MEQSPSATRSNGSRVSESSALIVRRKSLSLDSSLLPEIAAALTTLIAESHLLEESRFSDRVAAMDRLEVQILDPLRRWREGGAPDPDRRRLHELLDRAEAFRSKLEEADEAVFDRLRDAVRGGLRGPALRSAITRYAGVTGGVTRGIGYDDLDDFVAGVFLPPPVPEASKPLEPDMVFYQPTPARVILEMIQRIGADENRCFIDIGSGLGLVPMLVHLLTGARTIGLEVDPAYHHYAGSRARALGIAGGVEFQMMDAREADYGYADVIFLYTPFLAAMLDDVLAKLRVTCRPDVRIFSYGPCTPILASRNWIRPVGDAMGPEVLVEFRRAEAAASND